MKLHAKRKDGKRITENEFNCLAKSVAMNMYNHQSCKRALKIALNC